MSLDYLVSGHNLDSFCGSKICRPTIECSHADEFLLAVCCTPICIFFRSSIEFDFRPEADSISGLVLASGDDSWEDMAATFLHQGQLVFARQCALGNVFEIYRKKIDDGKWHSVSIK